ncbi:MAG TPA: sigma-70 family RNA polymerase sigma factor [Aquihabitans sp.]|nr:sigma-70 family RNA polymerase sigma factor [Aquihabitans sp.]
MGEEAVRRGDGWADAVRASYEATHARLWRAVLGWSGSTEVADEAVAEAYAQLLRRGSEVRDPDAWAWRTAFRVAAGELARGRAAPARGDAVPEEGALDQLPSDAAHLVEALGALSEQQRACVVLVDVVGHTAPSAARVLDTTAATVRVQLVRGRRRLRALLAEEEP